jgi:enamine deaminase RidA (YjgF/YER057c/UK114 family)
LSGPIHVNLPGASAPRGYSDATIAPASRRILALGGHVAYDADRVIRQEGDLPGQMATCLQNLKATLAAAGGEPRDLIKLTILVTDVGAYRAALPALGRVWRSILGPAYPAMTLLGVAALYDTQALIEIDGWAALP